MGSSCTSQPQKSPPSASSFIWEPTQLLERPYAVILLNQPVRLVNFAKIWNGAQIRISVDGGSNRLYDLQKQQLLSKVAVAAHEIILNPDLITGDFDSITNNTLQFYENNHVRIVETPDQDYTDFTKALLQLQSDICSKQLAKVDRVITIVEPSSGRLDQVFANLKTLFTPELKLPTFIVSQDTLTWLLQDGVDHQINFTEQSDNSTSTELPKTNQSDQTGRRLEVRSGSQITCGLIPLSGPTRIHTTGLKWNLDGSIYRFDGGGIVSTSNHVSEKTVHISCDKPIIWTMSRDARFV